MPPLPIIADTYRCSLIWQPIVGVKAVNVFHIQSASGNVLDVASNLATAMTVESHGGSLFSALSSGQICNLLQVLPLDGTTAALDFTIADPLEGPGAGEVSPATAALVSFKTAIRGPSGRGRMFIGPCRESVIANGLLDAGVAGDMYTDWEGLRARLVTSAVPSNLCVASYVHESAEPVTSVKVEIPLATQRRRQGQLR